MVHVVAAEAGAHQLLEQVGFLVRALGAAEAREEASSYRLKQVSQQVLLRAITAYADVSEKQEVLALSWEKVQTLTHHLNATQKQFDAGELTITDISQSEARLARAEAELKDAEAALEIARTAYMRETGLDALSVDSLPPMPVSLPKSEQEIMQLAANHPALITAKENERAADYTIDERTSTLLPQVSIQGQMNDTDRTSNPGLSEVDQRAVMLQVSVPIFQSGAEYARLKEAKHEYARARSETSDINRQVIEAALSEWHDFNAAGKVISSYAQSIAAAEKALRSVEAERLAGTRTVLDVLNAQEELYSSRIAMLRAKTRYVVGSYRLLVATGTLNNAVIPSNA
jgi:TolC family type I secretion outer membrane protein